MTDVVNLNQFRKAKDRIKNRKQADENAAKFGRSKSERHQDEARARKAREALNQHHLEAE